MFLLIGLSKKLNSGQFSFVFFLASTFVNKQNWLCVDTNRLTIINMQRNNIWNQYLKLKIIGSWNWIFNAVWSTNCILYNTKQFSRILYLINQKWENWNIYSSNTTFSVSSFETFSLFWLTFDFSGQDCCFFDYLMLF